MQKIHNVQWCRSLLSIGGIICYFTPILPYFQHWRGRTSTTILFRCGNVVETKNKTQMEHFFPQIQVKTKKKKRSSSKIEHIFPPNSGEDQNKKKKVFSENRSLTFFPTFTLRWTSIQNVGGDADVDHSQTIGGDTAKIPLLVLAPLITSKTYLHQISAFNDLLFMRYFLSKFKRSFQQCCS